MSERLTTLKATPEEIYRRKHPKIEPILNITEMPRKQATSCTREQANNYWEQPPKKVWVYIQANYPDIAERITHRIKRSKEIAFLMSEMYRYDKGYQAVLRNGDYNEPIDDNKDFEVDFTDSDDILLGDETDQYNDGK